MGKTTRLGDTIANLDKRRLKESSTCMLDEPVYYVELIAGEFDSEEDLTIDALATVVDAYIHQYKWIKVTPSSSMGDNTITHRRIGK